MNPNGLATTAWFEYGTDSSLSTFTKTTDQAIAVGTVAQSINATLLGLTPGTKYYFRVAASSTAGTSKGTIETFHYHVAASDDDHDASGSPLRSTPPSSTGP